MKKNEERRKWKGLKNGFLLVGFIALLIASSQTVRAEEINWLKAAEIAKRYVTLPQDTGMKAKEKGRKNKTGSPFIYIMMRGDRDSLSYLVMTRWEKCWDTAKKAVSIRSMPIPA